MADFFLNPYRLLWRHRVILRQTALSDIRARHAGSTLGLGWLLLHPLLFLGAYAAVYVFIFHVKIEGFAASDYVTLIFCGLIPFLGFSESLGTGVASVTANANLIKNTMFPIELIPVKSVLVAQCTQAVGTVMLLLTLALLGRLGPWALLLPVLWLTQLLFTIGAVWILASSNVILRDLQNMVAIAVPVLMMLSPIAYTAEMVPSGLRPLLILNPLYYVIVNYQDCLFHNRFPGVVFLTLLAIGVMTFSVGYSYFVRLKHVFAENV